MQLIHKLHVSQKNHDTTFVRDSDFTKYWPIIKVRSLSDSIVTVI